jgi:hypothetical protein
VKFISFSSIFLEVGNIYPQDYSAFPSISLSVWLETYPAEKKVLEDLAWILFAFLPRVCDLTR